jgi:hypothetical protein
MNNSKIKAKTVNVILIVLLILAIGLVFTVFHLTIVWFNDLAVSDSTNQSTSTKGTTAPNDLTQLQNEINGLQDVANKAKDIAASSQDYQTSIQQDLNKYASSAGVIILDFSLEQSPTNAISAPMISGVQSKYVKITPESPVTYTNLIKFLKAIESSVPKMKITDISLNRVADSKNSVTVDPITIEVYTR